MPYPLRIDSADCLQNVGLRGIAGRPVFPTALEIRYFLSLLARQARRQRVRVVDYAILTNHVHLLLWSMTGEISLVMQWVEALFVRRFNVTLGRKGALFERRFYSNRIDDPRHLRNLIRYFAFNPVQAGLTPHPSRYPWCGAFGILRGSVPAWQTLRFHTPFLENGLSQGKSLAEAWDQAFGKPLSEQERLALEATLRDPVPGELEWRNLLARATPAARQKLRQAAWRADGRPAAPAVVHRHEAMRFLQSRRTWLPEPPRTTSRGPRPDPGTSAIAGVLRDLAGVSYADLSRLLRISDKTAVKRYREHRNAMLGDNPYSMAWFELARRVLDSCGLDKDYPTTPDTLS
ncbi:MAG: hypothetical protein R3F30_13615 [Planctomycetota bacterium]